MGQKYVFVKSEVVLRQGLKKGVCETEFLNKIWGLSNEFPPSPLTFYWHTYLLRYVASYVF